MKFKHPPDTKHFLIGVLASLTAVIIWDIYKYRQKLLEFKHKNNE